MMARTAKLRTATSFERGSKRSLDVFYLERGVRKRETGKDGIIFSRLGEAPSRGRAGLARGMCRRQFVQDQVLAAT